MNAYLQAMWDRVFAAKQREAEKRDAEAEAYGRVMVENAEYIANCEDAMSHAPREG